MSFLTEIWITSSSIFSRGVSLRALKISIESSYLYSKYYHAKRIFGNLIFAIIARMLCGNHLNCFDFESRKGEQQKRKVTRYSIKTNDEVRLKEPCKSMMFIRMLLSTHLLLKDSQQKGERSLGAGTVVESKLSEICSCLLIPFRELICVTKLTKSQCSGNFSFQNHTSMRSDYFSFF